MKLLFKNTLYVRNTLLAGCFFFNTSHAVPQPVIKNKDSMVRVQLASLPTGSIKKFVLICPAGFSTQTAADKKATKTNAPEVLVERVGNGIAINGQRMSSKTVTIIPARHEFVFQAGTYHGSCLITIYHNQLLLINLLPLEEYVSSVLRTESWPGWPIEVNKVFAIASRSYALAMMLRAQKTKKPFDIKNTNEHQTYQGVHDCTVIKDAVLQTRGVYLAYDGKPIIAMFDCCCGGVIPARVEGVDFKSAPYLARNYACKHCKQCKIYRWRAEFEQQELNRIFAKHLPGATMVRDIAITKKDKAGVSRQMTITSNRKTKVVLTSKEFCALFKEVKSPYFAISKNKGTTVFEGYGYGHHLGLCQWGAREMVRERWHYKQILQFYYPGTMLARL